MKEIENMTLLLMLVIIMLFVATSGMKIAKKVTLLMLGLIVALWLCGCQMMQKKTFVHKGYVCYTNATIMEVKNSREQLKFMGAAVKPEKKKMCDTVLRTDQNEMMTASREGYVECSTNTVNGRVTVYTFNNQVIGINDSPDPYLEENNANK